MRPLFASTFVLSALGVALGSACGDSTSDGGGGSGGGGEGLSNPDAICIDNTALLPATPDGGLQLHFRVLDDTGQAVRPLVTGVNGEGDVTVTNDENGKPFGQGDEGDSVSQLGAIADPALYSVLVLDMSDSIWANGLETDVLDGARTFIHESLSSSVQLPHRIAVYAIGRPEIPSQITGFLDDEAQLNDALDQLQGDGNRGTTDLYGAYSDALSDLDAQGAGLESETKVIERFLVLISDGTHEAGNGAALREYALQLKHDSSATKIAIGIAGNYDGCALEELSGRANTGCGNALTGCREGITCSDSAPPPPSCTQFLSDIAPSDISQVFSDIAALATGIARSNYVVGICTPVAIGASSVTLRVDVDGAVDTESLPYDASHFSGQVDKCNADEAANKDLGEEVGGGGTGGGGGAGGSGGAGGAGGSGGAGGTAGTGGTGGAL